MLEKHNVEYEYINNSPDARMLAIVNRVMSYPIIQDGDNVMDSNTYEALLLG